MFLYPMILYSYWPPVVASHLCWARSCFVTCGTGWFGSPEEPLVGTSNVAQQHELSMRRSICIYVQFFIPGLYTYKREGHSSTYIPDIRTCAFLCTGMYAYIHALGLSWLRVCIT